MIKGLVLYREVLISGSSSFQGVGEGFYCVLPSSAFNISVKCMF